MPTERIPLVGVANQRSIDGTNAIVVGQDQRFLNCVFDLVKNPITGKSTFYVEKRPGWQQNTIVSAGNISTGLIKTDILGSIVSAFGSTSSTIYDGQTSVGAITGQALYFSETSLPSGIGYVMIRSSDGTGWYYASDSGTQLTYVGDTHTNTTIDNIASTVGMYSGQAVSGTNIQAGSRISTVDSATQITLDTATTGTTAGVTITKTPIAKIISANFVTTGTNISGFTDLDGYQFYCTEDGYVYNSDLNTVQLYTASNKIAANIFADLPAAIFKTKQYIGCLGQASIEFFHNAGNPAGSPLSSDENLSKRVGTLNQRSVVQIEDDTYFVSSSREGDLHVKKLSYLTVSDVSTPAVEKILGTSNASGLVIFLNAFNLGGYSYLLLPVLAGVTNDFILNEDGSHLLLEDSGKIIIDVNTSQLIQLVYNIQLNIWSEWDSTLCTFIKGIGAGSINRIIASSRTSTSGKIYDINPSAETEQYTDDGAAYSLIIRTSKIDFGTDNRKSLKQFSLIGDIQPSGTLLVEYSDDDYATWQTWGTIDLTLKVQNLSRGGSFKGGRAFRFTHTANAPFRAQAFEIDYSVDPE